MNILIKVRVTYTESKLRIDSLSGGVCNSVSSDWLCLSEDLGIAKLFDPNKALSAISVSEMP